ncbi:MAG: hypothetical protein ACKPEY_02605 [Planctomycetota bacterium]
MSNPPTAEETAFWQRRLASQANDRAWSLTEAESRTPQQDEEMLNAAHAAQYFWNIVGNDSNRAHAALLLAHVYALLKLPGPAQYFLDQSQSALLSPSAQPWEVVLAHAVVANVAAARGDANAHREHYQLAFQLVEQLSDPEDRKILEATLRILPQPDIGAAGAV